jgi:hypothetical protein
LGLSVIEERLMKHSRYIVMSVLSFLLFGVACSSKQHIQEYTPKQAFPRMIYIEDQVKPLKTEDVIDEKQIYVEVRTKKGTKETGKLIRITENELVMSRGFYYPFEDESLSKFESEITIPKQDIFILKVW